MTDLYVPLTLPELPRSVCPHEVMFMEKGEGRLYVEAEKCKRRPDPATGWCEYHQYAYDLLQAAAAAGYPEIIIGALIIASGLASWEGYAQRAILAPRHDYIMKKLKWIASQRKKEADQQRQQIIARMHQNIA